MSTTTTKPHFKNSRVSQVYDDLIRGIGVIPSGNERDLVGAFVSMHDAGHFDGDTRCGPGDSLVLEMAFRVGRADIVVFHQDGSATVIEAKDGSKGFNHVVSGIGQAGLYATQLALKGSVKRVHRALLWSSTGKPSQDILIWLTCLRAGVVAVEFPHIRNLMAASVAAQAASAS